MKPVNSINLEVENMLEEFGSMWMDSQDKIELATYIDLIIRVKLEDLKRQFIKELEEEYNFWYEQHSSMVEGVKIDYPTLGGRKITKERAVLLSNEYYGKYEVLAHFLDHIENKEFTV